MLIYTFILKIGTFPLSISPKNNGSGKLHSLDIRDDVGTLLSDDEKQNWELHILKSKRDLKEYLSKNSPFDVFIHNSNHSNFGNIMNIIQFYHL